MFFFFLIHGLNPPHFPRMPLDIYFIALSINLTRLVFNFIYLFFLYWEFN